MNQLTIAAVIAAIIIIVYFCNYRRKHKEPSLYERLGGVYAIAAVVNYFSDAVVNNPIAGKNTSDPALREWYATKMDSRLPGLKWMRTLWLCDVSGGPYKFIPSEKSRQGKCPLGLEKTHAGLTISPDIFDAVAGELSKSLDHFGVSAREKGEVLAAFAAHKPEIIMH